MDDGGHVVLLVPTIRPRPGGGAGILGVAANRYDPGVGWGTAQALAGNETSDCGEPAVAATRGGTAFAGWRCWGPSVPYDTFVSRFASAPSLTITSPRDGEAAASQAVRVLGTTDPGAGLSVNGLQVSVNATGAFGFTIELPPGNQTVAATAVSPDGDTSVVTVNVTVPDVPGDAIAELDALQAALDNATARLDATEGELAQAQADYAALQLSAQGTADQLASTQSDLAAAAARVTELEVQSAADRAKVEDQRQELVDAAANVTVLEQAGAVSAARVDELEKSLASVRASLDEANASLSASAARADAAGQAAAASAQAAGVATVVAIAALAVACAAVFIAWRASARRRDGG